MGLCWDGLFQSLGWRFLDRRRTLLRTLIHDVFRLDCPGGHFEPPDPPPPDPDFNDLNHDHKNAYYVDIHGCPWKTMEINGYLYISMHFHGCPWISMDIGQRPVAKRGPTISAPPQAAHLGVVDNSGVCRTSSNDHHPRAQADRGARPPDPPRRTQPP